MWPIRAKENRQLLIMWPNLIPYSKLVTVLLSTSIPLLNSSKENGFRKMAKQVGEK